MHFRVARQTAAFCALVVLLSGCGTTRRSDTARTATEQLLLSDAIDRSVSRIDFGLLGGRNVFLDNSYLGSTVDKEYITSTLRQHMLACGCILKDKKEDAELVVEVRAGTIGTDRHDLLFGTPATTVSLGALSPLPGAPTQVPEIALAKRTDQMGVAKIAVFAYERSSGTPVWQSGSDVVASRSRDLWVFGTGPFQRGNIYGGTKFAGDDLRVPLVSNSKNDRRPPVRVARERLLNPQLLSAKNQESEETGAAVAAAPSTKADAPPEDATHDGRPLENSAAPRASFAAEPGPAQPPTARQTGVQPAAALSAAPRSQFDAVWATPPVDGEDHSATADRRWPASGPLR